MSWHYLQGQEAASWEGSCLDGAPSALLSLIPTQEASFSPDSVMDACQGSPFGTMCVHSEASNGGAWWMSFPAGSHAKTFRALPAREQDSTGNDLDCGPKWQGSSAKYDQDSHSWRTAQCSLFGGLEKFSGIWPRWGMMHDGEFWALDTPAFLTTDSESGLLPTIMHNEAESFLGGPLRSEETWADTSRLSHRLIGFWKGWRERESNARTRLKIACHPTFAEWMMGWPMQWTDLQGSATDSLRLWWQWYGSYSPDFQRLETRQA
jgi:hypothetical protein